MMDIAIVGPGEVVIRFIDKKGQTLIQERLIVSGSPTVEGRRTIALSVKDNQRERGVGSGSHTAEQSEAASDVRQRDPISLHLEKM
jgi:hypothetical protein